MEPDHQETATSVETDITNGTPVASSNGNTSQSLFPESPVYEPEEMECSEEKELCEISLVDKPATDDNLIKMQVKRKLSGEEIDSKAKLQKLELNVPDRDITATQSLDDEVFKINKKRIEDMLEKPTISRVRTPVKGSPMKVSRRSNSSDVTKNRTPKTPKTRPASVDITKERKTLRQINLQTKPISDESVIVISDSSHSRPSVEFVREILPPIERPDKNSDNSELNDSQNFHLVLSPTPEEKSLDETNINYNSDVVVAKDREEILDPGKIHKPHSEGYNYSDLSSNLSQPKPTDFKGKSTDQESTDSVCSLSPDHVPSVASKLISKLSNGNSSTPTDVSIDSKIRSSDNDITPDMSKIGRTKGKPGKNESFRVSNTTTPSTISPLPNGHSLPITTPQIPVFDVHVCNNEDGEILSLYVVRTDNDLGMDMCKEYQRFSKRFTIDPYLADVSTSNSPSSVTSGGMINLPNRTSFASTTNSTSTSSSNRTSDGAFVVPQAPRKSISNPTTSVKGYDALIKKLHDVFSYYKDVTLDEGNRSSGEDKVSIGIQVLPSSDTSLSNGNASPDEVSKCDKATPKSSLKKTKVRGRRPLAGKTKRAILPTQAEEPEFMHGMNSPEMVPMNGDGDKSPIKSPKQEKPLSSLVATPKSVSKLKQKRGPTSPRPATPVEKSIVKQEYPGYPPDTAVLAKWVDKRYYSGRVHEITEPNKYLIEFDDGHSKVLLDDFIIFGDMKRLPLQGQSVYAMVDEEQTYEPGLVLSVEENDSGTITYRCTTDGDTVVMVTASELYLTEDQARSLKESARPRSPAAPATPRRRHNRELDLDNIIQGPRSARSREKGSSSARKRTVSPKSPKASTSGVKSKQTPCCGTPSVRKRVPSESSSLSESSNHAPPARLEEVAGVEPEVQRTPRKIDGVKAGPLQLKGAAKQTIGKKNSKLAKFENDEDTITKYGPIPTGDNKMFSGLHFLLTCAEVPKKTKSEKDPFQDASCSSQCGESRHYSSEEDSEANMPGTDTEDFQFTDRPFNKERLKEQIEAAGGIVHSHFDEVPRNVYSRCKLIAPRPCLTAKYIQCLAGDVRALAHEWVVASCGAARALDPGAYVLPAGFALAARRYINWELLASKRSQLFKDKIILLCGEQDTFVKFWERVCTFVGAITRVVNEEDLNMSGALALVTEWDCPHEVQNKANQDNVPLVSTTWVVQCLIEAQILPPNSHVKFSFMYTEPE